MEEKPDLLNPAEKLDFPNVVPLQIENLLAALSGNHGMSTTRHKAFFSPAPVTSEFSASQGDFLKIDFTYTRDDKKLLTATIVTRQIGIPLAAIGADITEYLKLTPEQVESEKERVEIEQAQAQRAKLKIEQDKSDRLRTAQGLPPTPVGQAGANRPQVPKGQRPVPQEYQVPGPNVPQWDAQRANVPQGYPAPTAGTSQSTIGQIEADRLRAARSQPTAAQVAAENERAGEPI
jgi:hypothetical protein